MPESGTLQAIQPWVERGPMRSVAIIR